ncbi:MAG: hypothetical protein QF569_10440 [Candidatus Poribacteria bacterium]|nr:hypothetical protein [Candidatus Poribacteria bacterium]
MKLVVKLLTIYGRNSVGWRCGRRSKHDGQGGTSDVTIHLQDSRQTRIAPGDQLFSRLSSAGDCLLPRWSVSKRDVAAVSPKPNAMLFYNPGLNL